jgi:hypothetical protein
MAWPSAKAGVSSGARSDVPADIPDAGGEFAGERDADLVVLKSPSLKPPVAVVQPQLCAPGGRADLGRLSLLAQLQGSADAGG